MLIALLRPNYSLLPVRDCERIESDLPDKSESVVGLI